MKRSFLLIGLLGVMALHLSGCTDEWQLWDCDRVSNDDEVTQTFAMADFDRINLFLDADVYLTQGPEQRVRVEGPASVVNGLNLGVRNSTWDIDSDRCTRGNYDLKIYITVTELRSVNIASTGSIEALEPVVSEQLDVKMNGSGTIRMDVEASKVFTVLNGSGNIVLNGHAGQQDIHLTGSGDVLGFGLESGLADISITGSGNTHVFVQDLLDVSISGSGSVFYKGRPDVSVSVSGSGKVVDSN